MSTQPDPIIEPVTVTYEVVDTETGAVVSTHEFPADHPLVQALQPGAPRHTREEWAAIQAAER